MKTITVEEYAKTYSTLPNTENPVITETLKLEVGQTLVVGFDEWEVNYPTQRIYTVGRMNQKKFKIKTHKPTKEWLITRVN